jgi:hypothetical protein
MALRFSKLPLDHLERDPNSSLDFHCVIKFEILELNMAVRADIKVSSLLGALEITTSATIGVDRTLSPEGFAPNGVIRWVDRSGGIALLYPSLTMLLRPPTKGSRVYRLSTKYSIPTGDITSPSTASGIQPQPSVAYACQHFGEWVLPERSTLAERLALFSNVRSLYATTIQASDAVPSDATGSPFLAAVSNYDAVF